MKNLRRKDISVSKFSEWAAVLEIYNQQKKSLVDNLLETNSGLTKLEIMTLIDAYGLLPYSG